MNVELLDDKGGNLISDADPTTPDAPTLPRPREGESRREYWERCRKAGRSAGMDRREAYDYATVEADRVFAPGDPSEADPAPDDPPAALETPPAAAGSGVAGLGDLPADWPSLPANASLQAEVGWVQGNRVLVVQGGRVDLSRALSPAPSYAALAWLETSVLFPSKFADVTLKATSERQDDAEDVRRERLALGEVRTLLGEASATPALDGT
jgi:hypothetical protein